ncbi:MAG: hypothetical protein HY007_03145 [Candidatus Sungbacteria bacterium]|nr:hypothetical protein [Candidatus Sungbacteria bacterium]
MNKKKIMHAALAGAMLATTAVSAFAEIPSATTGSMTKKTLDIACMSAGVDKRDTAIAGVFDSLKSAVMTRRDALKSAWGQTDKKMRRDAIRAAWKAYAASVSSARTTRKSAWTAFYADRKACGPGAAAEDATTHAADQNL